MTTVAELNAAGSGRVAHLVEVTGFPALMATVSGWWPGTVDAWVTTRGYETCQDWLQPLGIDTDELSRFIEGDLEAKGLELSALDPDGAKTAELADYRARVSSRLASAITAIAATIPLLDASKFPVPDVGGYKLAWLGLECVKYTSIVGNELRGCTRGWLGTVARAYDVDDEIEPPIGVMVTDGPTDIRGRPCRVWEAVWDDVAATWGATSCIFRGFVGTDVAIGRGLWRIPLEHVWTKVSGRNVGQGMPSSPLTRGQYWYGGTPLPGLATIEWTECEHMTDGTFAETNYTATIGPDRYGSPTQLALAILAAVVDTVSTTAADLTWGVFAPGTVLADGSVLGTYALVAELHASLYVKVRCREGDPLWALGFEPAEYKQDVGTQMVREAGRDPRAVVVDWSNDGASEGPELEVEDGAKFTAGLAAAVPGNAYAIVSSVSGNVVKFRLRSQDRAREQPYWAVEDDEDLVLRHVFALSPDRTDPDTLVDAVKRFVHLLTGQLEPDTWCAMGLAADDVDWTELDAAVAGCPTQLLLWYDAVTKPTALKDLIAARLGVLGVAPRIIAEGKIGWARAETAIALNAEVLELDDDMWSGPDAADAEAVLGGEALLTQGLLRHSLDYRDDSWGPQVEITWEDGIAERGAVRAITYDLRGVVVDPTIPGAFTDHVQLRNTLSAWMTAIHYNLFGRLSAPIDVKCIWTARQLLAGDVVKVTHPNIPDLTEGELGVTARLATVYGKTSPHTSDQADVLRVRFAPVDNASGIAPGALGDSWDVANLKMVFSQADTPLYAAAGGNDLTDFTAGDNVLLWAWDTATQPVGYPLAVKLDTVDVGTKSVIFASDPFSGAGLPASGKVWMTWADWDAQQPAQQAWLSICGVPGYDLGAGNDPPFEWGV